MTPIAVTLVTLCTLSPGATVKRLSLSPSPPFQQTQPAAPKVSAELQAEFNQLAAAGLRLKEALEATLDGAGGRHLAAVFERTGAKNPAEAYEFRIIESDGKAARTIFTRKDFFFSFAAAGEATRLNGTDINGDGRKEIIVQSSSGGNCWSCNPVEVYQVKDGKATLIAAAPIQKIADLNNDELAELVVTDARWEFYGDLSHAASPSAKVIYAWRGGRYVNASRDFAEFYRAEIGRLRALLTDARALVTDAEGSDDTYVGVALTLAVTQAHAGDAVRGVTELETLLAAAARTAEQKARRTAILKDFRGGDSAKKLAELKYGDPLL